MKKAERENLKNELLHLKECQIRYFVLSVTAAGAIVGFGGKIGSGPNIYWAPFLVILPCWWIFFDKGSTITRIVGYLQLLEGMILENREMPYKYIGWENALGLFREDERNTRPGFWKQIIIYFKDLGNGIYRGLFFQSTQKYWSICWYTFFSLSLTSLWLSYPGGSILQVTFWGVLFWIFVGSFIHNLRVLGRLISGSYSYKENHKRWKKNLKSPKAQRLLENMFE